jgi:hypothetical protein
MDSGLHSHQRPSVDSSSSHYSKAAGKHEWPTFSLSSTSVQQQKKKEKKLIINVNF